MVRHGRLERQLETEIELVKIRIAQRRASYRRVQEPESYLQIA